MEALAHFVEHLAGYLLGRQRLVQHAEGRRHPRDMLEVLEHRNRRRGELRRFLETALLVAHQRELERRHRDVAGLAHGRESSHGLLVRCRRRVELAPAVMDQALRPAKMLVKHTVSELGVALQALGEAFLRLVEAAGQRAEDRQARMNKQLQARLGLMGQHFQGQGEIGQGVGGIADIAEHRRSLDQALG